MKFTDGVLEIEEEIVEDVRKLLHHVADNCYAGSPDSEHAGRVRSIAAREGDTLTIRRFEIPLLRGAATTFLVTAGHDAMQLRDRLSSETAYDLPAIGAGFDPSIRSHLAADSVIDEETKSLTDFSRIAQNLLDATENN